MTSTWQSRKFKEELPLFPQPYHAQLLAVWNVGRTYMPSRMVPCVAVSLIIHAFPQPSLCCTLPCTKHTQQQLQLRMHITSTVRLAVVMTMLSLLMQWTLRLWKHVTYVIAEVCNTMIESRTISGDYLLHINNFAQQWFLINMQAARQSHIGSIDTQAL